jgi:hypothetical protein
MSADPSSAEMASLLAQIAANQALISANSARLAAMGPALGPDQVFQLQQHEAALAVGANMVQQNWQQQQQEREQQRREQQEREQQRQQKEQQRREQLEREQQEQERELREAEERYRENARRAHEWRERYVRELQEKELERQRLERQQRTRMMNERVEEVAEFRLRQREEQMARERQQLAEQQQQQQLLQLAKPAETPEERRARREQEAQVRRQKQTLLLQKQQERFLQHFGAKPMNPPQPKAPARQQPSPAQQRHAPAPPQQQPPAPQRPALPPPQQPASAPAAAPGPMPDAQAARSHLERWGPLVDPFWVLETETSCRGWLCTAFLQPGSCGSQFGVASSKFGVATTKVRAQLTPAELDLLRRGWSGTGASGNGRGGGPLQVQAVSLMMGDPAAPHRCHWPRKVSVTINSHPVCVTAERKSGQSAGLGPLQVDFAVDVTPVILRGHCEEVLLEVGGVPEGGGFAVGLRLVRAVDAAAVEARMAAAGPLEGALARVRDKVGGFSASRLFCMLVLLQGQLV